MIRKFLIRLKGKYYFVPLLYAFFFSIAAFSVILFDYYHSTGILSFIPKQFLIERTLGESILLLTAGSAMTILTVSFSIIMIVLTLYGNQLSPRTVQDFLEKKATMRVVGFFIGVLIFCIISLFGIHMHVKDANIISPAIAVLLFILSLIIFIYFMNLVARSVQINVYIQNLTEDAMKIIEARQKSINDNPLISIGKPEEFTGSDQYRSIDIVQKEAAFIQYYNEKKLFDIAESNDVTLYCGKKAGEYVQEGDVWVTIHPHAEISDIEALSNEILKAISTGNTANLVETQYSETSKLVEIAVKSLSPGINDPATAVICINSIGSLLSKAVPSSEAKIYRNDKDMVRVILEGVTFNKLLFEHFYQIKYYGSKDLMIIGSIITALNHISLGGTSDIKKQIWEFSKFLVSDINIGALSEFESNYLKEMFYHLSKTTKCSECLGDVFLDLDKKQIKDS